MAVLFSLLFWFWVSSQSHFILRELLRDWSYKASDESRCERYRTLLFLRGRKLLYHLLQGDSRTRTLLDRYFSTRNYNSFGVETRHIIYQFYLLCCVKWRNECVGKWIANGYADLIEGDQRSNEVLFIERNNRQMHKIHKNYHQGEIGCCSVTGHQYV